MLVPDARNQRKNAFSKKYFFNKHSEDLDFREVNRVRFRALNRHVPMEILFFLKNTFLVSALTTRFWTPKDTQNDTKKLKKHFFCPKIIFIVENVGPPRKKLKKCGVGQTLQRLFEDEKNFRGSIKPYTDNFLAQNWNRKVMIDSYTYRL